MLLHGLQVPAGARGLPRVPDAPERRRRRLPQRARREPRRHAVPVRLLGVSLPQIRPAPRLALRPAHARLRRLREHLGPPRRRAHLGRGLHAPTHRRADVHADAARPAPLLPLRARLAAHDARAHRRRLLRHGRGQHRGRRRRADQREVQRRRRPLTPSRHASRSPSD